MNTALIAIVTAYIALAVLLLGLCLYSKWSVWIKAGAIVLTGFFYYATYFSLQGLLGWPTQVNLPGEFIMLAGKVEEPNEKTKEEGAVYLWALPLDEEKIKGMPRSYIVPYSKSLHNQVTKANKRLRRGIPQVGKLQNAIIPKPGIGQDLLVETMQRIDISDFPDPELPDK